MAESGQKNPKLPNEKTLTENPPNRNTFTRNSVPFLKIVLALTCNLNRYWLQFDFHCTVLHQLSSTDFIHLVISSVSFGKSRISCNNLKSFLRKNCTRYSHIHKIFLLIYPPLLPNITPKFPWIFKRLFSHQHLHSILALSVLPFTSDTKVI